MSQSNRTLRKTVQSAAQAAALESAHNAEVLDHCVYAIPYKGYTTVFQGYGTLALEGRDGTVVRVNSDVIDGSWLDDAWNNAKARIDANVLAASQSAPNETATSH